jgi:hypothetical protein
MTSITVDLTEDQLAGLRKLASRLGVTVEELVRASVSDILSQPEEDFRKAADNVLEKNAELYRRLA